MEQLEKFAVDEVRSGRVKLHKEEISTVLYFITTKDIYQLRLAELNAYYLPEKDYYLYIVKELNRIISPME